MLITATVLCIAFAFVAVGQELYADHVVKAWVEAGFPDLREPGRAGLWLKLFFTSGIGLICLGIHAVLFPDGSTGHDEKKTEETSSPD